VKLDTHSAQFLARLPPAQAAGAGRRIWNVMDVYAWGSVARKNYGNARRERTPRERGKRFKRDGHVGGGAGESVAVAFNLERTADK
jgi:hypothetical protein